MLDMIELWCGNNWIWKWFQPKTIRFYIDCFRFFYVQK